MKRSNTEVYSTKVVVYRSMKIDQRKKQIKTRINFQGFSTAARFYMSNFLIIGTTNNKSIRPILIFYLANSTIKTFLTGLIQIKTYIGLTKIAISMKAQTTINILVSISRR